MVCTFSHHGGNIDFLLSTFQLVDNSMLLVGMTRQLTPPKILLPRQYLGLPSEVKSTTNAIGSSESIVTEHNSFRSTRTWNHVESAMLASSLPLERLSSLQYRLSD